MKYVHTCIVTLVLTLTTLISNAQQVRGAQSIGYDEISVIEVANNGDIWAGSASQGVAFYSSANGTWEYFNKANTSKFKSDTITSIQIGIIGTEPHAIIGTSWGIALRRNLVWDTLGPLPNKYVTGVFWNLGDTIWTTTSRGVATFDTASLVRLDTITTFNSSIPFDSISCIQRGGKSCGNGFTAGTNNGVFYTEDGVNFQTISTSFLNLVDNRVNCIFRENNCIRRVVGTKGGLSYCPEGLNCQNYTTANGLPQNDIVSISQDCKGNFWIGTRDSGLVVHNGIQFQRVTTANGLTSNYIKSITFTSECEALVGLGDGNIAVVDTSKNVLDILSNIGDLVEYMSVRVYPQPAHQQVQLQFSETINDAAISIHNLNGQLVKQYTFNNCKEATLHVEDIAKGMYFYTVKSNDEIIKSGKLLIE